MAVAGDGTQQGTLLSVGGGAHVTAQLATREAGSAPAVLPGALRENILGTKKVLCFLNAGTAGRERAAFVCEPLANRPQRMFLGQGQPTLWTGSVCQTVTSCQDDSPDLSLGVVLGMCQTVSS